MIPVEVFLQYGISGLALWMLYSITYNHLSTIKGDIAETNRLLTLILSKF